MHILDGFISGPCDKCGQAVSLDNDALALIVIMTGNPIMALAFSRHLLPEGDCIGSPSRAQYLPGQPQDTRGYVYNMELYGVPVVAAYAELKEYASMMKTEQSVS